MRNYLSRKHTITGLHNGESFTEAKYFYDYCHWYSNALRDMGIADEIINEVMTQAWATNYEFFEALDSYTLISLLDNSDLNDILNRLIEEYDEALYNDLYEYCLRNLEYIEEPKDLEGLCLNYRDTADEQFEDYEHDYVMKRLRDDLSTELE